MKKSLFFLSILVGGAVLLSGCGGGSDNRNVAAGPAAQAPADGVRVVEVTGNDQMKFNVAQINAAPGEKLRVVFRNAGKMPKQAMGHNWVLLRPMSDGEVNAFGMAASSKPPLYLPEDRSAVLAFTQILGPGESETLELTAPSEAGEYPFLCTFPGHFAIMRGKLVVR
jgi:azurin